MVVFTAEVYQPFVPNVPTGVKVICGGVWSIWNKCLIWKDKGSSVALLPA